MSFQFELVVQGGDRNFDIIASIGVYQYAVFVSFISLQAEQNTLGDIQNPVEGKIMESQLNETIANLFFSST